ncbi:Trk system potassium transporter TrkA [Halalkalicoccus tibetensis]|uniref:Trk system potassium transporter TrkA n=1 Tax=Halalkalicoccus tibetensis TaxID=175632 RepID=A0ABD5V8H7_9EURY
MHVIIVGAGEVGWAIADDLAEVHQVVVVDRDGEKVEDLTYSMDVLAVQGDGTDLQILEEARIAEAEMVIACTDIDEANIVVCNIAKAIGDIFTIGRVKHRNFLRTWTRLEGAFGVDLLISTDLLTAESIFRVSGLPSAHDVNSFAGGVVRMAEFDISSTSPLDGRSIRDVDRYDALRFAAVFRDDDLLVPKGDTVLRSGDRIVTIGAPDAIRRFSEEIGQKAGESLENIVIVGGSEIGFQTARIFEEHGYRPQLIERDPARARAIAEALPKTTVLERSATDLDFLKREHIGRADLLVATMGRDEQNLLMCILATHLGVDRTVAVIESTDYADLFEQVGIDVAISPLEEAAEEIIQFTRHDRTKKIAMLEHDRAEVVEVGIGRESVLVDREIADAMTDLPQRVVIGAISRDGKFVTPRGDTVVRQGDHLVIFVDTEVLDAVTEAV